MAIQGFDFGFTPDGEIIVDSETHDIFESTDDILRIQLAFNRIKSISNNWFIDEIGANLEELIGRPCTQDNAEYGKQRILQQLTFDDLWSQDDIYVMSQIKDNTHIIYSIYLRIYQAETEDTYSYEIETELDLVKGVFVRYGWGHRNEFKKLIPVPPTKYNTQVLNDIYNNAQNLLVNIDLVIANFGVTEQINNLKRDIQNCINKINMLKLGYGDIEQYNDIISYNNIINQENTRLLNILNLGA